MSSSGSRHAGGLTLVLSLWTLAACGGGSTPAQPGPVPTPAPTPVATPPPKPLSVIPPCALAPSNRIQVGSIGVGRISREHDLPGILKHAVARVVAVCELDSKRLGDGRQLVEDHYRKRGEASPGVRTFHDYRDLLAKGDVDAVVVSTPDHWHAKPAIDAALAGKDIYLQKPASLTRSSGPGSRSRRPTSRRSTTPAPTATGRARRSRPATSSSRSTAGTT